MALLRMLAGKPNGQSHPEAGAALERLLASIQTERQGLEAVLTSVNGCTAALPQMRAGIDEAEERASAISRRLDDLSARVDNVGRTTQLMDKLEKRVTLLESNLQTAEVRAIQTLDRSAEVEAQREGLEKLVSLAADTLAKADGMRRGHEDLGRLEAQLYHVLEECRQIRTQQTALTGEFDRLGTTATSLAADAETTRQSSEQARESVEQAALTISEIQQKLEALSQFESVRHDTGAQLQTLNALAEHVASKLKNLENQRHTVERALVDSQRVAEMVWKMDGQIARLNEGTALGASVEQNLTKLEQLHQDTTVRLDNATRDRNELANTLEQHQQTGNQLLQSLDVRLSRLALTAKEIETLGERVATAHSALTVVEARLEGVSTSEGTVKELSGKVDALAQRFAEMNTRADILESRQSGLSGLEERLDEVETVAKRTGWQIESLAARRQELDDLKRAFEEFDSTLASAQAHTETLRADKRELAHFVEQMDGFMREAPAITSSIDALKIGLAAAEASAERTAEMRPLLDEVGRQLELLPPRLRFVEDLQTRLGALHASSAEIDRKLAAQLGRQAELDSVKIACDGLSTQLADAQQRLDTLASAQTTLALLPEQISELEDHISVTRAGLEALRRDEAGLAEQERSLVGLNESASALARDLSVHLEVLRGAQDELAKAGVLKEGVRADITEIQGLQRETLVSARQADDQIQQLTARWKQINERRSHLEQTVQTVTAVENRLTDLERSSERVDAKIESIAARERIVDAVKQEVETIHAIAQKTQADLAAIADAHAETAQSRVDVQRLLDALAETAAKIGEVERRGVVVDEVRRKADAVIHLLDDIRVTLDTVSEQKATIDHVSEKMARLDEMMNEVRGVTKALQNERTLAQRIVEKVRTVHARAGADIRQVG